MKKGEVPYPGIDTDARWWSYSHTKEGWVFGYKLHLTSTTAGDLVVPLTAAYVTTANVPDNKMYVTLNSSSSSSSSVFSLPYVLYMIADLGHDAKKLYGYSKSIGNKSGLSYRKIRKYIQEEARVCMLLSIDSGTGYL
jgi:hypothetical protein